LPERFGVLGIDRIAGLRARLNDREHPISALVCRHHQRATAEAAHFRRRALGVLSVYLSHDDVRAHSRKLEGCGTADAATGAGDYRDLSLQLHMTILLCSRPFGLADPRTTARTSSTSCSKPGTGTPTKWGPNSSKLASVSTNPHRRVTHDTSEHLRCQGASHLRHCKEQPMSVRVDVPKLGARLLDHGFEVLAGRNDSLVNNAGIYRAAPTLEVTEEHWDAIMNINAKAVFFATQAVLPTMIEQKRGIIVSLASMAGKIGSRANLPYNASKAAVISMTKSLAVAHAADGIRVNCVCPGFVETDMWTAVAHEQSALLNQSPEEFTRRRASRIPLGRMERPEDVANVIGFLVSPRSEYMTGQALSVDGGLVMHG
jgi:NAD(P)-dependent dehydrogenase (short-subunit alcohol dehydrogenase family)